MYSLMSLTLLGALSSRAVAQCFFPNGDRAGTDTACNPNALVSACCFDGQACLSNGLCVGDPHNAEKSRTFRGTCTDQGWKSGNCPRHCTSIDNLGANVYSCNQTNTDSYCCFDNCKCSDSFETFSFGQEEPYTITIIGEDFTPTPTATTSASATASITGAGPTTPSASRAAATSTPGAESDNKSSSSTAIGVGVGVGVGGAALIGALVFIFFWMRRRKNNRPYYPQPDAPAYPLEAPSNPYYPPVADQKYAYVAPTALPSTELPASEHQPVELPSSPMHKSTPRK